MVEEIRSFTPQDLADLDALMHELSTTSFCNEAAEKMNVHHIQLTSNPARVAANRLYQELGFERYETNCYKRYTKAIRDW